jgi:ribulose 1,5-bisphosphate synthetase/thiazole synthase
MRTDNGRSTSIWMDVGDIPEPPQLDADTQADMCIAGAGIAGLTTAYLLGREGRTVVVMDDRPLGGGVAECIA